MTHEIVTTRKDDEKFAIDAVFEAGWKVMKAKFWPLLGVMGVAGLVAALVPMANFVIGAGGTFSVENIGTQLLMGTIWLIITMTIELGFMNVNLMALDGKKFSADDCFKCIKFLPSYAVAMLLSRMAIGLGFLCFIIPGIILLISFQFAGFFIVEKRLGPIAALKASWTICDGARWQLILFGILGQLINLFGTMCFIVGQIPAFMINGVALASTYRSLLASTPQLSDLLPPPPLSDDAVSKLLSEDAWPLNKTSPESASGHIDDAKPLAVDQGHEIVPEQPDVLPSEQAKIDLPFEKQEEK